MTPTFRSRYVLLPLLALLALPLGRLLAQAAGDDPAAVAPKDAAPIHRPDIDELAIGIRGLYLREDHGRIRAALRELQDACRELQTEDQKVYGKDVLSFDRGLHRALDRTRELAADGLWKDSETQYEWVLRSCTRCHQVSRELGLGPQAPLP
jgi:hypothetical protein